jgi:hypothetical protein
VQVRDGIFVISLPLICTGVPTSPSAHAKVTLPVVSVRAMSFLEGDTVPRKEQFLSRPLVLEWKYKAPPPRPTASFPLKLQSLNVMVPPAPAPLAVGKLPTAIAPPEPQQ